MKMINAFLFPGQGSQTVGMGQNLYENLPKAKEILDRACDILGYDLKKRMFEGPMEELTDTRTAQPAIYTCSAMYLELAREMGLEFSYAAGHSLGEYSALYACGVFGFEEGLRLIDVRSNAMASENGKGTMAAVMGLTEEELSEVVKQREDVCLANLNTKTQIVISGTESGISEVTKELESREITVKKLSVSAAFHSPQMAKAAGVMKSSIEELEFKEPKAWLVPNVTGRPAKDIEKIKECLTAQITGQVRWHDSILAMKECGAEAFYEVGNGKVLRKMNKVITLRPKCFSLELGGVS